MADEPEDALMQAVRSLPPDSKECFRFFGRSGANTGGCYVVGWWAAFIAREYIKSSAVLKDWGTPSQPIPVVVVNDKLCKEVIRDCLLRRGAAVEYYERAAGGGGYTCVQRGSPGNIADFEASLFEFEEAEIQLMATGSLVLCSDATSSGAIKVGFASLNTTLRCFSFAEYVDTPQLASLDALVVQTNLKELTLRCLTGPGTGQQHCDEECVGVVKRICGRAGVTLHLLPTREGRKQQQQQSQSSPPLQNLADLLRVPEERVVLNDHALAARAMTNLLLASGLDALDPVNQHAFSMKHVAPSTHLRLDTAAVEALHLVSARPEPRGSLPLSIFAWLNQCVTGMGSRIMRQWLLQPLRSVDDINQRLTMVGLFVENPALREQLVNQVLRRCADMDRLNRKLQRRTLALRDVQSFLVFVDVIPAALEVLRSHKGQSAKLLADEFIAPLDDMHAHMANLKLLIHSTVDFTDRSAARINPAFDDTLQELHEQLSAIRKRVDAEYTRVLGRYKWNEKQLKCEYHGTHGYVFRVPRKEDHHLRTSTEFITLCTAKDGVRFASETLAGLSDHYRRASEDYDRRQQDLKRKLVDTIASYLPVLDDAKEMIAALDVFAAWSLVVKNSPRPMVRPTVHEPLPQGAASSTSPPLLALKNVRHPLVELRVPDFVANSLYLASHTANGLVLTGPNMGGKSTYMRSVGIATVLAQAGCYVPADAAELQLRDAVFCRVGAADHLAQGVSTFMLEMLESAAILSSATSQTLAIVDELGRGTSTYDGFGLAWAIAQDIAVRAKATLLFSTHFHELTALPAQCGCMVNMHFGADVNEAEGTLRFSYRIEPGPCGRSYGLYVAALARLPEAVVECAKQKACELENFEEQLTSTAHGSHSNEEMRLAQRKTLASVSEEVVERVAMYSKRIRALDGVARGGGDIAQETEAARQRLRKEIEQDAAVCGLLEYC